MKKKTEILIRRIMNNNKNNKVNRNNLNNA